MNEKHKRSMIIHFNDGSKKLLEFIKYLQVDGGWTAR